MLIPATALLRGADWPDWRPARTGLDRDRAGLVVVAPGPEPGLKRPTEADRGLGYRDRPYLQNSGRGAEMQAADVLPRGPGKLLWD
jgi:hypothetical protein